MKKTGNAPYWPILPSALALAGIMVFIFATFGPPASSSGFVTTMKGFFCRLRPNMPQAKPIIAACPAPAHG